MKSWRSVRSIVSFTSFRSGASSNADDKKQSTWRTVSKNNLMPASKVSQQTLPSVCSAMLAVPLLVDVALCDTLVAAAGASRRC